MALQSNCPTGPIEQRWEKHRFNLKLVNPANKRKYEVIVVGSGLAGASRNGERYGHDLYDHHWRISVLVFHHARTGA